MTRPRGTGGWRVIAWGSAGLMLAAWAIINLLGDRFWWTVPIIYGPRWVWGALLLGTLPQFFRRPGRGIWPLLVAALLFGFGILDLRLGLGRIGAPPPTLRVLEFNAQGDTDNPGKVTRLVDYIREIAPDLVMVAECGGTTRKTLEERFPDYAFREAWSVCLLAKAEVLTWEPRSPKEFWARYGSGVIVRADLLRDGRRFRVGLVHLATPRRALANYNDSTGVPSMRASTEDNRDLRNLESQAARFWITDRDSLPTIIGGDFNLPIASAIYQRHWGDLGNAFSSSGVGLGHTKEVQLWGVRIDHILAGPDVKMVRAWIGPDLGSDHLPLVAEIALPR